jgi:hypothetical protein
MQRSHRFFPRFKSTMEAIFLTAAKYCLWFSLDVRHCFQMSSLQFHFQFGKWSKITGGQVRRVGRMWNDNHVVSHKLCGFQGRVGRRVVTMKEPVMAAPKFQSFSSHIFSHASQNVTVKVRVDRSVRRNKFMVNSPLHAEKDNEHALCWTPDLSRPFCSWWSWALPRRWLLLCFSITTVNLTFFTLYDPRDKSWVLVSLLS